MNQSFSWAAFATGLVTFLGQVAEVLTQHQSFHDFTYPSEVAHLLILGGSFVGMLVGAFGVQMPRKDVNYGERKDDLPASLSPQPVVIVTPHNKDGVH